MSKKISISCHALQCKYGDVEAIEIAAAAGFDGVDFNVVGYAFQPYPSKLDLPENELESYFGAVRDKAKECGIKIYQTHNLCGKCYNGDPENDKKVLYWAERGLRINQILECPLTVIHPIGSNHYGGKDAPYELIRSENQDRVWTSQLEDDAVAVILCDGMGGENAGSVASQMTIDFMSDRILKGFRSNISRNFIRNLLITSVTAANSLVYDKATSERDKAGMGTTCVAAIVYNNRAYIKV